MNTLLRLQGLSPRHYAARAGNFDNLFASLFEANQDTAALDAIRLDVSEDANAYRVEAALAGTKKEDIHVSVEKNTVKISAEVKREVSPIAEGSEAPSTRTLHRERFYGKTARTFSLAKAIDEARVEARYADGVLTLVLPKLAEAVAKRVEIS